MYGILCPSPWASCICQWSQGYNWGAAGMFQNKNQFLSICFFIRNLSKDKLFLLSSASHCTHTLSPIRMVRLQPHSKSTVASRLKWIKTCCTTWPVKNCIRKYNTFHRTFEKCHRFFNKNVYEILGFLAHDNLFYFPYHFTGPRKNCIIVTVVSSSS